MSRGLANAGRKAPRPGGPAVDIQLSSGSWWRSAVGVVRGKVKGGVGGSGERDYSSLAPNSAIPDLSPLIRVMCPEISSSLIFSTR